MGKYLIMTGQLINAQQALQLGLITEIVKSESLGRAMEIAEILQAKSPIALRMAKRCIDNGQDIDLPPDWNLNKNVFFIVFYC